jgi:hypothetical protein
MEDNTQSIENTLLIANLSSVNQTVSKSARVINHVLELLRENGNKDIAMDIISALGDSLYSLSVDIESDIEDASK